MPATTRKNTPRLRDGVMKRGTTWSYVIRVKDPETGVSKPRWVGGFATEEDAKGARDEARVKARHGEYIDRNQITVAAYLDDWIDAHAMEIKARTLADYRACIRLYTAPRIGHLPIQAVRPPTITKLYRDPAGTAESPACGVKRAVRRAVAGAPERAWRADRVSSFAGRSGCHWLAGLAGPHDAGFVGQHDHLDPVAQSEFGQDAGDVAFHRGITEVEPPGDLGVGQALGDQLHHLKLAAGQLAKILMLTTFDLDQYVYRAMRAGASGFLLKTPAATSWPPRSAPSRPARRCWPPRSPGAWSRTSAAGPPRTAQPPRRPAS